MGTPRAPKDLSETAKRWWLDIRHEYDIADVGGLAILTEAARSYDRMLQAAAILARDGLATDDRYGQVREHPMLRVERQSREQVLRALKLLNLDTAPVGVKEARKIWL